MVNKKVETLVNSSVDDKDVMAKMRVAMDDLRC